MTTRFGGPPADVAEVQGLYGAFTFSEKLLQKIWLRRDFDAASARTTDGRRIRIVHPGRWNLLGGPDFRGARLRREDESELVGDVELHLHAADWDAHAHAQDPAYDGVVLHVVLFEPEPGRVTRGADGRPIPVLVLLPLLHHSLEEHAIDEAVECLADRPTARLANELMVYPPAQVARRLRTQAERRWRQKVRFARMRIERLGWENACHHAALEVLGFRYNRAPMLRFATRWPLSAWANGDVSADEAFAHEADAWSLQGVRPANQPRVRLRQYLAWVRSRPDWPARVAAAAARLSPVGPEGASRAARRLHHFGSVRDMLADELCAGTVEGSRFENLVCDAVFPLLAGWGRAAPAASAPGFTPKPGIFAETPPAVLPDPFGWWFHWFCGDTPPFVLAGLRQLGVCDGREQPVCHGLAQGLLGWLIERDAGTLSS
ncbi:MAG TPA: DUF2851 family protein [Opitutaceae bacterium]|nr:DUF2851 family protein [Opitutaceae bacterium]